MEGSSEFYYWRSVEIPFEGSPKLFVSWNDGSYSDNYERVGRNLPFVEEPISVEVWQEGHAPGETHPFVNIHTVQFMIDALAAPRPSEGWRTV